MNIYTYIIGGYALSVILSLLINRYALEEKERFYLYMNFVPLFNLIPTIILLIAFVCWLFAISGEYGLKMMKAFWNCPLILKTFRNPLANAKEWYYTK